MAQNLEGEGGMEGEEGTQAASGEGPELSEPMLPEETAGRKDVQGIEDYDLDRVAEIHKKLPRHFSARKWVSLDWAVSEMKDTRNFETMPIL